MIHLLVSNKHIQCVKWSHEDDKPTLLAVLYAPYKSKKISDNLNDKELVNEINTALQLQKKKFSFEGEQVYVTIPDAFCASSVVYPDEEMSEADGWELSKWSLGQRSIQDSVANQEFFGRSFSGENKSTFSLKISSILTETIKISIQEMGGSPFWMGTESSAFFGLNPSRGVTLFINDKSGYEYFHYSKNFFAKGLAKFSKNSWKLSSSDGSINEKDIFKGQTIIPGKLSYRRKSHFEGKRIRQIEPFKNIKKNEVKIPKEFTIFSQSVSSAVITGDPIGSSLNFFDIPGIQEYEEIKEPVKAVKQDPVESKKRKKLSKKRKSSFQQFFAYMFFFGALSAVIFREQLPFIYEKVESEVRLFLYPPTPDIVTDEKYPTNPRSENNYFNQVSFVRSQSLVFSVFTMTSLFDNEKILKLNASNGKMDIVLTGPKNTLFPVDTLGSILNYSLRQVEGKDLYEFGYLVQYHPYLNEFLKPDNYTTMEELRDYLDKFIDLDIKKLDSFSRNAIEHTPIIISTANMNSYKDILSYMLSNGSNLVLEKSVISSSSTSNSNTSRLYITFLNYSDS